jgi:hypothetical protein
MVRRSGLAYSCAPDMINYALWFKFLVNLIPLFLTLF